MELLGTRFKKIPLNKLVKADWNYKSEDADLQKKLENNIARNGQIENIIVRELDDEKYEVINGNHRIDAFRTLGIDEIIVCDLGKISKAEALAQAIATNETKFRSIEALLYERIAEAANEISIDELGSFLPYDSEQIQLQIESLSHDFNAQIDSSDKNSTYEKSPNSIDDRDAIDSDYIEINYKIDSQVAEQFKDQVLRITNILQKQSSSIDLSGVFSAICIILAQKEDSEFLD